jgi:hypothetical protein
MAPPQGSPALHARSSPTPNSSSFGRSRVGLGDYLHLDATAGHRPLELTIRSNDQQAANGYRRRARWR